jgi:branched-chain amino acid transport system substrate-binding protein
MLRSEFLAGIGAAALLPNTNGVPNQGGIATQYNLGLNVPLTGPLGQYGAEVLRGVQACIDETNRFRPSINSYWGVRTFDDQNSATVAASNVFVAASDPSVIGMIGNLTVDTTLASLPQYANANFAIVVPSVTADVITARGFHNVFRLPTKDSSEGQLFARSALRGKNLTVVAVATKGDYGEDTANGFISQAKVDKHDATLVDAAATGDPENIAAVILKHNPTIVFLAGKPDRFGPIAKALRKQGYKGDFGASDGFFSSSVVDPYGEVLNGTLVATSTPPLDRIPTIISLLRDFQSEVGNINAFSAYGYAAAQLIIAAAGRANARDRFGLLTSMQQGGAYNLIVGQYAFNFTGDATLPNIYLYRLTPKGFTFERAAVPSGFVV